MGLIIQGICKECGYRSRELYFGSGKADFDTCIHRPVLDHEKNEIVMITILIKGNPQDENNQYSFYDIVDNESGHEDNRTEYIRWGENSLKRVGNSCPKCQKKNMDFSVKGHWD